MARLPSLRLLMGFEAAARHGNYSRAADELCLSQSAVSHQIAQLEEQIGQSLFRRTGRGVELTMAGKALLATVSRSLELMRGGLDRISTYLDPGLVVIVCPAPVAQGWLQTTVMQAKAKLPSLCPLISIDESARYVDENDVDITIGFRPLQQAGILEREFLRDELVVVAKTTVAEELNQIPFEQWPANATLICLEQHLLSETYAPYYRQHFSNWKRGALFDDMRVLLAATISGQGVACVSRLAAHDALARNEVHVLQEFPVHELPSLWIARRAGETRTPLISELFDQLISAAP